ncbi:hypothetical protein JV173_05005 [Acholeplasma equirhinis]|uniref:hypothetical protein n=1 Tax=Acholeplasma equirhinis TaxID=555393 RepID=UPI00197AFE27|nr:hypothetical protein [Acholeplasma equirhinis]MBN3490871.1 hypothetical protein [Acholeplasma equirhinis]
MDFFKKAGLTFFILAAISSLVFNLVIVVFPEGFLSIENLDPTNLQVFWMFMTLIFSALGSVFFTIGEKRDLYFLSTGFISVLVRLFMIGFHFIIFLNQGASYLAMLETYLYPLFILDLLLVLGLLRRVDKKKTVVHLLFILLSVIWYSVILMNIKIPENMLLISELNSYVEIILASMLVSIYYLSKDWYRGSLILRK